MHVDTGIIPPTDESPVLKGKINCTPRKTNMKPEKENHLPKRHFEFLQLHLNLSFQHSWDFDSALALKELLFLVGETPSFRKTLRKKW